jgi:hypothetical protein
MTAFGNQTLAARMVGLCRNRWWILDVAAKLPIVATEEDGEPESAVPAVLVSPAVSRAESPVHVERMAHAEDSGGIDQPPGAPGLAEANFDRKLVRNLLAYLITDPDVAMEFFYARLFADHPDLRGLFPYEMTQTRVAVFRQLATLVRNLADAKGTLEALGLLARDHRKFGVKH